MLSAGDKDVSVIGV